MDVAVSGASSVLGKALSPVVDGFLEAWAASAGLGPNVDALKLQLLYAQAMLDNARGREIRSPALGELLHKLRDLAYDADELEYFRIQDVLHGTHHAAVATGGCVRSLVLNARHTARAIASKLKPSSATASDVDTDDEANQGCLSGVLCSCGNRAGGSSLPPLPATAAGKHLPCCFSPSVDNRALTDMSEDPTMPGNEARFCCGSQSKGQRRRQRKSAAGETPLLMFDRVEISRNMKDIVDQLKPVCAMVSTILNLELMGSHRTGRKDVAMKRPVTTSAVVEPELYGRDDQLKNIVDGITHGEYFANKLTVLPIVGPGGIGKTTFVQHVCQRVEPFPCLSLDMRLSKFQCK